MDKIITKLEEIYKECYEFLTNIKDESKKINNKYYIDFLEDNLLWKSATNIRNSIYHNVSSSVTEKANLNYTNRMFYIFVFHFSIWIYKHILKNDLDLPRKYNNKEKKGNI